ncbi:MAG: response regulator [Gemmataceae bacterium]|nr:response regulator [Gemmataceae bacterium]
MLVLSRRPKQSIVFPALGITVRVLKRDGGGVRLGVTAPPSVVVMRGELDESPPRDDSAHRLRGRFNTASLALRLAQRQLQLGMEGEAERTLEEALAELARLESAVVGPAPVCRPRPITALLVEDNPHESALLRGYLRLRGVEVADACDGDEALGWLASHERPDAVLLDMRLPRRDGPATVAAIRADPANESLKVFAVTGGRPDEFGATGRIDGWFTKPLDPARIVEALERAIG